MNKSIIWAIVLVAIIAYAQPPDTLWTRTYGGSYIEVAMSVQPTITGGYIFAGWKYAVGNYDIWFVATDADGDTLWTKTYGQVGVDVACCVQKTFDGGYILVGDRGAVRGTVDVWLLKTDENGDTLWTKTYGGSNDDEGFWVQQTPDTGYVIYARTLSFGAPNIPSVWLLRTNAVGDTLWSKTYGVFRGPTGQKDVILPDGYMLPYNVHVNNHLDFGLLRVNALGDTLWSKTYGWSGEDYIYACTKTDDGGYIAVGATDLTDPDEDVLLVRFAANGDTLWTRTFGGPNQDGAHSVHQVFDGGYILGGWTYSFGAGGYDFWFLRTDTDGNMVWQTAWGGTANDFCYEVQVCADSSYILTGETYSFGNSDQAWLIKTGPDMGIAEQPIVRPLKAHQNLTATIFCGQLQLPKDKECKVFDITGRVVAPDKIQPGIYFIEIDGVVMQKVVKIRQIIESVAQGE